MQVDWTIKNLFLFYNVGIITKMADTHEHKGERHNLDSCRKSANAKLVFI